MTPAQKDAMNRVSEILNEHFTGSLLAVVGDVDGHDGKEMTKVNWHGGRILAMGLAEEARDWLHAPAPEEAP